jgi:uncharacterized protein YbjT (DUF2867 family)
MAPRIVTVFGATGFLGRRIVRGLHEHGCAVRIASRHPDRGRTLFGIDDPRLQSIGADVHDGRSVTDAVRGALGVVNAVSLYIECGKDTFHSVQVACAQCVAIEAHRAGVEQLAHVSGIGANAASGSSYIRSRGQGELAVQAAFPGAIMIRPAVMFAPDDAFLTVILKLLRRLPAYPMLEEARQDCSRSMWPTWARIARVLQRIGRDPVVFECAGPRVYTYQELLRSLAREVGLKPMLFPIPLAVWYALARAARFYRARPLLEIRSS